MFPLFVEEYVMFNDIKTSLDSIFSYLHGWLLYSNLSSLSLSVDFDFIAKTKYLQDKPLFLTLFIRKRPIYVKLELRLLTDLVCPSLVQSLWCWLRILLFSACSFHDTLHRNRWNSVHFLTNALNLGVLLAKKVATTVRQAVTKMMCRFYVVPI